MDTSGGGAKPAGCAKRRRPLAPSSREDVPPRRLSITWSRPAPARLRTGPASTSGRAGRRRVPPPVTLRGRAGEARARELRARVRRRVRLRPSRRPPVAAAVAALSLRRPPPKGLGPGQAAAAVAGMPRVYIGRLSYQARERDVERFFKGYGKILEVDLKNG